MAATNPLDQYATLLRIRQKARRRDARLSGGVFLLSLLISIGWGLLSQDLGRSAYLLAGLIAAFGLSFLLVWVRLEIINHTLELIGYLEREAAVAP
jgi:hypothetical protein